MEYIAHRENNLIQTVKEHSEGVAKLCSSFSIGILSDMAYNVGLFHDIGKYQKSFQKRISGENIKIEHSICGAKAVKEIFGDTNKIVELMSYIIAGHHTGIPDYGLQNNSVDDTTLLGRLKRETEDYSEYKNELKEKKLNISSICEYFEINKNDIESNVYDKLAFMCRYLYSCLVDADTIDTVKFCKGVQYETLQSVFSSCLKKINEKLESFTCKTELQRIRSKIQQQAFSKVNEKSNTIYVNATCLFGGVDIK